MASGVRTRGRGSRARGSCGARTEAPSADNALNAPQLNPEFEVVPAAELIARLNRSRRTADLADAALVFAARERRLAEAEERMDRPRGEIGAHEAQIRRAAETEMGLRAEIRALQLRSAAEEARVRHGSGSSGRGLTQQAGRGLCSIQEAHGEEVDRKVLQDVLGARVIAGCKVPKEEEHPARATKKAGRQKGTSYYKEVLNDLMEKHKLLKKEENEDEEAFAKEAAATASKLLYRRCWPPFLPSEFARSCGGGSSSDGLNDS